MIFDMITRNEQRKDELVNMNTGKTTVKLSSDPAIANAKVKIFFDVCRLFQPANEVWD